MKKRNIWLGVMMTITLFGGLTQGIKAKEQNKQQIYEGVYLGTIDVGGKTPEEATALVEEQMEALQQEEIQFIIGEGTVNIPMADVGLTLDYQETIDEAVSFGRAGNILKRFHDVEELRQDSCILPLEYHYEKEQLKEMLEVATEEYVSGPSEATVTYEEGELIIHEGSAGQAVDYEATFEAFDLALQNWKSQDQLSVDIALTVMEPTHLAEELKDVKDPIGVFETRYSLGDVSRNNNIINAASKINGSVIYPGEEFDTMSHLVPFTTANGWSYAGAYLNGEVISDIGGGICQLSTTLYNAVLQAELEVSERHPHSMAVGYVQLAADAALNEGTKNFKFVNNTDVPVYIYAYAANGTIHVSIFGKETREENRKVEYHNEILATIPAGDPIETVDESKPADYREVTQTAHTGYKVNLWKYVYVNGELVDKILVNTSSYHASPARVTIGKPADPATEVPPSTETPAPPSSEAPVPPSTEAPAPPSTEAPVPPSTEAPAPPSTEAPVTTGA